MVRWMALPNRAVANRHPGAIPGLASLPKTAAQLASTRRYIPHTHLPSQTRPHRDRHAYEIERGELGAINGRVVLFMAAADLSSSHFQSDPADPRLPDHVTRRAAPSPYPRRTLQVKLSARGLGLYDPPTQRMQRTCVMWLVDKDRLATMGFSKMSDHQVALWETGALGNGKMTTIDQTSGVLDG